MTPRGEGPRPVALVTGASSGIGREIARLFAADRWELVLVARREGALRALAGELTDRHEIATHAVPADLADPGGPRRVADEVEIGRDTSELQSPY